MSGSLLVYALVDPRTEQVRYIGKSSSGLRRPTRHKTASILDKDRTHKGNWIRKLLSLGLVYAIKVLEYVDGDLSEREKYWISYGRAQGWPLTNLTDGGEGCAGYKATESTRRLMSLAKRGKKFSKAHRKALSEVNRGKVLSQEHRDKISASRKALGLRLSPTHRRALLEGNRRFVRSPSLRKKISLANTGLRRGEETRRKLSELRKRCARPVLEVTTDQVFSSRREAAEVLGVCVRSIGYVIHGRLKHTGGYRFKEVEK